MVLETTHLPDADGYLARMRKSNPDKLRLAGSIPAHARHVLDVGCADGALTAALAEMFPNVQFIGIDLRSEFVQEAQRRYSGIPNVQFEHLYLRDLLAHSDRFDCVLFASVLHEFFHYGEGMSSVMKAFADAYELLLPRGTIPIRDMILVESTKHRAASALGKILRNREMLSKIADFEKYHGEMGSIYTTNHFLLKYFYDDNWEYECPETYVPVTVEEYLTIASLLGMKNILYESYLLPFLREKWRSDFGFTDADMSQFKSTTLLTFEKPI